jgi:hypothetical protein
VTLDNQGNTEISSWFIGGRSDNQSNFEGRIDEVAVFGESRQELIPSNASER